MFDVRDAEVSQEDFVGWTNKEGSKWAFGMFIDACILEGEAGIEVVGLLGHRWRGWAWWEDRHGWTIASDVIGTPVVCFYLRLGLAKQTLDV